MAIEIKSLSLAPMPNIGAIKAIVQFEVSSIATSTTYKLDVFRKLAIDTGSTSQKCILSMNISVQELASSSRVHSYTFVDNSVESNVPYIYGVNLYNSTGALIVDSYTSPSKAVCFFDDIFIQNKSTTFCVKFNPNISSVKYNLQEQTIATLGGAYPVYRRNSIPKYKSFSLSGTISIDAEDMALYGQNRKTEPYLNSPYFGVALNDLYRLYNENDPIIKTYNTYMDLLNSGSITQTDVAFGLEQMYRDAIIKFLQDGTMKLFKSPTEGNMLVYITGVSLTPNQQLGRRIYDFSCQVVEAASLDAINAYINFFDFKNSYEWDQYIGDSFVLKLKE